MSPGCAFTATTVALGKKLNSDALAQVGGCATDPQIEWDVTQQIWLYSLLVVPCAVGQTDSWLNVGWSKTSDPSDLVNGWCHFSIFPDGDHTKVFDYPKLGHNDGWLLVGGNMFTSAGAFSNTGLLTLHQNVCVSR